MLGHENQFWYVNTQGGVAAVRGRSVTWALVIKVQRKLITPILQLTICQRSPMSSCTHALQEAKEISQD